MSVIDDIKDSHIKGDLIPFVGAGFSENIDGYPNWQKFIKILEADINIKLSPNPSIVYYDIFGDDPLEAAEHYVWTMGDWSIKRAGSKFVALKPLKEGKKILLNKLKYLFSQYQYDSSKWNVHDKLVKKFNKTIYTTNWDDTLEKALNNNLEPIYRPEHFRTIKTQPSIIKFHGHFKDKKDFGESLIACETDYLKRLSEENPFDIKFKNDLLHNDFLFIGYSFNDPNVKLVLYQIGEIMNRYKVQPKDKSNIFWLSSEYSDDKRVEMLTHRGIKPYFLLKEDQQLELKHDEVEIKLKIKCRPCSFFWKCNDDNCANYIEKENIISAFNTKKKHYLNIEISNFLDQI